MTILMLMVIILSTITSVVNMKTSKVVAQIVPPQWVQVDPTSFRYNEFIGDNKSDIDTLTFLYSATIDNDARALQLTSPGQTNICQGLVIYSKSLPFQGINRQTKRVSTTSFSTIFSFSLLSPSVDQSRAGFVFFLMAIPANTSTSGVPLNLSFLTLNNMKPPICIIAIEYDVYNIKVFNDTNTSCIGAGIDNVPSLAKTNPYLLGLSPTNGNVRYSWVDYNDASKELEVRISKDSNKPHEPIIKIMIYLTPLYANLIYVGFSSQTKVNDEKRVLIHSWSFETHPTVASPMIPRGALSLSPQTPTNGPIASAFSPTPSGSLPPVPVGPPRYSENTNNTLVDKAAYFGKVLGTTLGVLFLIMLILAILVGFSQFGFACIANPDDLIELEFSTLGEFSSSVEHGKENIEEDVEGKLDSSPKENESRKSEIVVKLLTQTKKQTERNDSLVIYGEEYSFEQGALWGDSLDYNGSLEDEAPRADAKTQATSQERKLSRPSIATILGLRRSSTLVKEPLDPPSDFGTINEKEQIANLLKEAAQVEEEVEATRYRYKELSEATNGFGSSNKLGVTSSGTHATYRGFLLESDTEIAVKVMNIELLKTKSKEVRAEMSILSWLQHPNLVKFLGWCKHEGQFYTVYELIRGQSLDRILFENAGYVATYPWDKRLETIKAIASALNYLHEGWQTPIIHRNVKSSSVMVENDPKKSKLGDYGLSCLIDLNQIEPLEPSSLYFQEATFGYVAPEFAKSKTGTQYTDVYSFGILCLEIACHRQLQDSARRPEEQMLVEWVSYLKDEEKLTDAIEDDIMTEDEIQQFVMVVRLSLMCVELLPQERPTMKQVVQCLSGEIPFPPLLVPKTFACPTNNLGEEIVSNWENSVITREDSIPLIENENEWTDIDMFVGDANHSFAKVSKTNSSWVDIHDNILFIDNNAKPSSQGNNSWVDIHDIELLNGNDISSYIPSSYCSWVDVVDISLDNIVQPISCQQGEENSLMKIQQMQECTLWTEIPTLILTADQAAQSFHLDKPISLEWVENSEVFNSSWENNFARSFKFQEDKPQSVHRSITGPRLHPISPRVEKTHSPRVEKTHLIPIGNNLPPPTWPLSIPRLKPNRKPKKPTLSLDVSPPELSLPKATRIHLNSPSTPSDLPTSCRTRGSHGSDSTLISSGLSSTPSMLPSSSPIPPSNYGNNKASIPSQHLADNPHLGSGTLSSRTSPTMELIDLKARSKQIKYPGKSLLQKRPDTPHFSSSKNKPNPTSQLHRFPPKWPIPLPKSNHDMEKKSE